MTHKTDDPNKLSTSAKVHKNSSWSNKIDADYSLNNWFFRMFFVAMIVSVLAIWLIPGDVLLRWSMWWNNIPIK